ncbi:UNVERIFIED_CONTAM: hypothetical protein FKN15_045165 [Acipenser sinensis]
MNQISRIQLRQKPTQFTGKFHRERAIEIYIDMPGQRTFLLTRTTAPSMPLHPRQW